MAKKEEKEFQRKRKRMRRLSLFWGFLAVFSSLIVSCSSEADPRGFTEDPLSTEEKFREKGKKRKKLQATCGWLDRVQCGSINLFNLSSV